MAKRTTKVQVGEEELQITAAVEPKEKPNKITHTVAEGETLGGIATKHGISLGTLRTLNRKLSNSKDIVGKELMIKE